MCNDGENQTRQPALSTLHCVCNGILLAASFFPFDCFFFSFCICYSIRCSYEYLHCALTCMLRGIACTAGRLSSQPTDRPDLSNFQFKLKPYYFHDKIIFQMGAPVRCAVHFWMCCFASRMANAVIRHFSNAVRTNSSSMQTWLALATAHSPCPRICMIYICNVLILMQNQLKIAWIYR